MITKIIFLNQISTIGAKYYCVLQVVVLKFMIIQALITNITLVWFS